MREKTRDAIGYVMTALFLGALVLIIFLTEVYGGGPEWPPLARRLRPLQDLLGWSGRTFGDG